MAVGNNNNVKAPTTYVTWAEANITVAVGEEVTVAYTGTGQPLVQSNVEGFLNGIATANTATANSVTFTGVNAGTATIPYDSLVGQSIYTASVLEITVTAATEDESYLNKRGLTHFWENIDDIKQDKLTAGTNITISANNTISASQPTVGNATLTIQKNGTNVQTFTANATSNKTANITVPTTVAELSDSSNYATTTDLANKQNLLSPGSHINIASDVISATGYVHSENPQASAAASSTITGSMIANGTITADKLATNATVKLTMSTSDIGEGAPLAANTLYGVYR